uniref:4Fe-4S ferredoxin-type domain-containing protein n=1 Tax=Homalodisca liturata TaxID=320908 RepID=A0A1B6J0Q7_9HEMI
MSGVLAMVVLAFAACLSTAQGNYEVPDLGNCCDPSVIECLPSCSFDEEAAKGLSCFLTRYLSCRLADYYTCISPNFMIEHQEAVVEHYCNCSYSEAVTVSVTYEDHKLLITEGEHCYTLYPIAYIPNTFLSGYLCDPYGILPSYVAVYTAAGLENWHPYVDAARQILQSCGIDDGTYTCAECCYEGHCYDVCP